MERGLYNNAFGWLSFILVFAAFCASTKQDCRVSVTSGGEVRLEGVLSSQPNDSKFSVSYSDANALLDAFESNSSSSNARVEQTNLRYRLARVVRAREYERLLTFKTASNRLSFERCGLQLFLFKEFWSSQTLITLPLYLFLLFLLD